MEKKPKKVQPKDPIREGLDDLLMHNKMPECFVQCYKIGLIMSLLFEPLKLGEIFRSMNYQCDRLFNAFGFDAAAIPDEMKGVYADYLKMLAEAQERALKELQKENGG